MTEHRLTEIFYECMEEIYQASIPSASFKELLETSPRGTDGKIMIPYESYKIPESLLDDIIEKYIKKYRLSRWYSERLKGNIYLGPSPVGIHEK